eukprot:3229671-Pleurochrysis_carterae.AAC.1
MSQSERHTWATKEQASGVLSRNSLRPLAASPRWDLHRDVAFTWPRAWGRFERFLIEAAGTPLDCLDV